MAGLVSHPGAPPTLEACSFSQRAMVIWPRLDRRSLARCGCDPQRIATYVAHRTSLPVEVIVAMLTERDAGDANASYYFG